MPNRTKRWSTKIKKVPIGTKVGRVTCISEPFKHPVCGRKGTSYYIRVRCDCGCEFDMRKDNFLDGKPNKKQCWKCGRKKSANSNKNGFGEVSGTYRTRVRKGAERRGIEFSITAEDMWKQFLKQDGKCALSGQDLILTYRGFRADNVGRGENTASLDRIDSNKGYTIDNIQWLHKDINTMKFSFNEAKFIEMCRLVADANKKGKDCS